MLNYKLTVAQLVNRELERCERNTSSRQTLSTARVDIILIDRIFLQLKLKNGFSLIYNTLKSKLKIIITDNTKTLSELLQIKFTSMPHNLQHELSLQITSAVYSGS